MASYNLDLKRNNGVSLDEIKLPTDWSIISNKPSTFTPTAHNHDASNINAGTLHVNRIPDLNMSKITSGNLLTNRLQEPTAMNAGATPTQRALLNVTRANRAAFMPAEDILVELSTDGGQSWTIQSLTDAQKRGLFSQNREFTLNFPTPRSTNNKIRITIDPKTTNISGARYAQVNQLYWWCGANGDRMSVVVERSTVGAPNTFSIAYNGSDLFSGWTGMAMVNFSTGSFGGGNTQTSNFQKYRFTFSTALVPGQSNLRYTGAQSVTDIRLYGDNAWTTPNPMMNIDSLFSWDSLQNAHFPANVSSGGQVLVKTNDSRLSDSRPASDVYSWAKAATKPSYNQDEVGDGTTYKRVTQSEKDTWNAKSTLVLGETSVTAYRGDRGKTAYDHSQVAHAPSNAQKNSDITKEEIEAKLTGAITTHTHAYAASSHAHGNIANAGTISSAAVTPASTDYILISDATNSGKIERGIAIGTGTTTYLRNDGTWGTPTNTWRGIDDTPVNGQTAESISSNWAYDHSVLVGTSSVIGHLKLGATGGAATYEHTQAVTKGGTGLTSLAGGADKFLKVNSAATGFELANPTIPGYTKLFTIAANSGAYSGELDYGLGSTTKDFIIVLGTNSSGVSTNQLDSYYCSVGVHTYGILPSFPSSEWYVTSGIFYAYWDYTTVGSKYLSVWVR
jgi:hypothetical protein